MLNFESVNCDGKHIKWEFNTPNEVHRLFWSDTCPLPSNDDPIVHAELDGKPLPQCKAFLDLLHMLGLDEELGEWVERKTVRQQRRIEGDK